MRGRACGGRPVLGECRVIALPDVMESRGLDGHLGGLEAFKPGSPWWLFSDAAD